MARRHIVQEGEWLSKIALQYGFDDGGGAIWDANPAIQKLAGDNPDLLLPGWPLIIPDRGQKDERAATEQKTTFRVRTTTKNLRVTLQDADKQALDGWTYTLKMGKPGKKPWGPSGLRGGVLDAQGIPQDASEATLLMRRDGGAREQIRLHIGSLDPVVQGDIGMRAVQKILTNLGLYAGKIDGDFATKTRAALRAFQEAHDISPAHGLADSETCRALVKEQRNRAAEPKAPEKVEREAAERGQLLDLKPAPSGPERRRTSVFRNDTYMDPRSPTYDEHARRQVGGVRFFPTDAHVVPCNPGQEDVNPNVIRASPRRFLWLDVGHWERDRPQDFGLIWGCHVYLCQYGAGTVGVGQGRTGLDRDFFAKMGSRVQVVARASATWAPESEFDWDTLYVMIPDLHLMTAENGRIWKHRREVNTYPYTAERDLRDFANALVGALPANVVVVQVGDLYDLWVSYPRMFDGNDEGTVVLDDDARPAEIGGWVRDIQRGGPGRADSPNPGASAFQTLESRYGRDHVIYIYGNHENYLRLREVSDAAGIAARRRFYEAPGVFMEHAHRLDDWNRDGIRRGYWATDSAYQGRRGDWGPIDRIAGSEWADNRALRNAIESKTGVSEEYSRLFLARQAEEDARTPHIIVTAHTHVAHLWRVDVQYSPSYRPAAPGGHAHTSLR